MLSSQVPADEQYKLIMECRQSGLSDQQWCLNHDIKPGTFYNWVKRLRQKGCKDIPVAVGRSYKETPKQEVVKLELNESPAPDIDTQASVYSGSYPHQTSTIPVMELSIGDVSLRISNGIDPFLLSQTIKAIKEFSC